MKQRDVRTCRYCRRKVRSRWETSGAGELVQVWPTHNCINEKRRIAGICQDCDLPVEGKPRWALRCAEHKAAAKVVGWKRHQERNGDRRRERARELYNAKDPKHAALRRKKLRRKAAWRRANPLKVKAYKRRYGIKHAEHLRQYHEKKNAEPARAERKRQHAMERFDRLERVYTAENPPRCACGALIPWNGRGQPMKVCSSCDPVRWRQAEQRQLRKQAA